MSDRHRHLHEVLGGYAKFLQDKNLAADKHQPYFVRPVREFLLFARRAHAGYSFEQTLERFLAEVGMQGVGMSFASCLTDGEQEPRKTRITRKAE